MYNNWKVTSVVLAAGMLLGCDRAERNHVDRPEVAAHGTCSARRSGGRAIAKANWMASIFATVCINSHFSSVQSNGRTQTEGFRTRIGRLRIVVPVAGSRFRISHPLGGLHAARTERLRFPGWSE